MAKECRVTHGMVNLTGVRKKEFEWYLAEEDPDGTIHLVPAILVPAMLKKENPVPSALEALKEHFPDMEVIEE